MAIIDIEYGKAVLAEYSQESPDQENSLDLEMVLQNSSIGHEYARMELEQAQDLVEREVLIDKMESYKRAYFLARRYLKKQNPLRLETVESQLIDQKVLIFGNYHA